MVTQRLPFLPAPAPTDGKMLWFYGDGLGHPPSFSSVKWGSGLYILTETEKVSVSPQFLI